MVTMPTWLFYLSAIVWTLTGFWIGVRACNRKWRRGRQ